MVCELFPNEAIILKTKQLLLKDKMAKLISERIVMFHIGDSSL